MTAPCPNQIIDATTGRTPPPSRLSTPSSPSTSSIGDQDEQKLQSPTIDAKERKRQRDRERYASMSVEKRKDINKKRREAYPASEGLTSEQPLIEEPDDEPSQEQESQQQEDPPQAADFAPEEANLSEEGRQDYALPSKYFMV
ncbi:hypothetical protein U9M48_016889 [Paspalum notatum var. saurae]|uniref:Uncharacterized protein n=1 Tax=Paspalum notatum var. saurae TaxID=547442 RepID=A0AAQ3WNM7_PASNO